MYNFRKQTTIQGNATLTDAANNAEIVAHELYGNTSQNGTPTPDNPVDIEVVTGRQEIDICGKNLIYNVVKVSNTTLDFYFNKPSTKNVTFQFYSNVALQSNSLYYYSGGNRLVATLTGSANSIIYVSFSFTDEELASMPTKNNVLRVYKSGAIFGLPNIYQLELGNQITDFEPYKGQSYEVNLGKNLLDTTGFSEGTEYGITKTKNSDGSITLKGTATADYYIFLYDTQPKYKAGTYTLSGCNGGSSSTYRLAVMNSSYSSNIAINYDGGTTFTLNEDSVISPLILVKNGTTIDKTFYPQIEKGSQATSYSEYITPIELCKIGDYQDSIKKGTGTNIWNEIWENGYWNRTTGEKGSGNNYLRCADYIPIKPNVIFYFNKPSEYVNFSVIFYNSAKQIINSIAPTSSTSKSYTTPDNTAYFTFYCDIGSGTAIYHNNIMINYGDNALNYEPYGYKDKWYIEKKIGKAVLDGSESWVSSSTTTNTISYETTITNIALLNVFPNLGYKSNYFYSYAGGGWSSDINRLVQMNNKNLRIGIETSNLNSADITGFKEWLSTHNTIVYYVLATPTYTLIDNEELLQQLDALENGYTYEGQTNITINNNLLYWYIKYQENMNAFRDLFYSGESNYDCHLYINNTLVDIEQIARITIKDPIIDTTSQAFYIGTFIAKQITVKFKNLDNLTINSGDTITLEIGQYYNNEYVYIPIGTFYIEDLAENYQTTCEITALDASVKFKQAVDYSTCFVNGSATIDTILEEICNICDVPLGKYPKTNGDLEVGTFNSEISGKQWISYIAELKGCNAKIDREGNLILIPLKQRCKRSINALENKSWNLGEKYSISQVRYYNGSIWFQHPDEPEGEGNILYIRNDNPFINSETLLEYIYDDIKDIEFYNVKTENYGDITLDAYDNIIYTLDEDSYITLNDNTIVYEMTIMSTVENKIPTKQQESTTNVILGNSTLKQIKTTVDLINGTLTTYVGKTEKLDKDYGDVMEKFDNVPTNAEFSTLTSAVETLQTDTYTKTQVKQILNGTYTDEQGNKVQVTKAINESGTFSDEGLRIQKEDENGNVISDTSGLFNEVGMAIKRTSDNKNVLFAGMVNSSNTEYSNYIGQTIVGTQNTVVKNFLVVGNNSRFQDYTDDNNNKGTGCFWIGD